MSVQHELLIELLRSVNKTISRKVKEVVVGQGLPPTVAAVARQVISEPGITVSEISRRTGTVKSHISTTIKQMEKMGWVEKKADRNDQRLIRIYLTPVAEDRMHEIGTHIREMLRELVADIPEERTSKIIGALSEINSVIQKDDHTPPGRCRKSTGTSEHEVVSSLPGDVQEVGPSNDNLGRRSKDGQSA